MALHPRCRKGEVHLWDRRTDPRSHKTQCLARTQSTWAGRSPSSSSQCTWRRKGRLMLAWREGWKGKGIGREESCLLCNWKVGMAKRMARVWAVATFFVTWQQWMHSCIICLWKAPVAFFTSLKHTPVTKTYLTYQLQFLGWWKLPISEHPTRGFTMYSGYRQSGGDWYSYKRLKDVVDGCLFMCMFMPHVQHTLTLRTWPTGQSDGQSSRYHCQHNNYCLAHRHLWTWGHVSVVKRKNNKLILKFLKNLEKCRKCLVLGSC